MSNASEARKTEEKLDLVVSKLAQQLCGGPYKTWIEKRLLGREQIVEESVGASTFRTFRALKRGGKTILGPSTVFREWATAYLMEQKASLIAIDSQQDYEKWLRRAWKSLAENWHTRKMPEELWFYGQQKLVNLLMKRVVFWDELTDAQFRRLAKFLHVPLDKYALGEVRPALDDSSCSELPKRPKMKDVNEKNYGPIQKKIREIAGLAKVPPICFDLMAFNDRSSESVS